jgi:uncharacterized membrane protein required for colicin V production
VVVNIEGSLRHLGAQVGALLGLLLAIFIIVLLKLPQMRRQIRQQRVVLETLVHVAHPLIENVERLLLLKLDNSASSPLARLQVIVVCRFHFY